MRPEAFRRVPTLVDLEGRQVIRDLETFAVKRDGQEFREMDFNFWGVAFSPNDPDVFYTTLSTGGEMLLMRARLSSREMDVVHAGVECPSVSPDGTRVVYKKREIKGGRLGWRLHVLNLQTLADVAVAEERSVDDQADWLNNDQVLYALPSRRRRLQAPISGPPGPMGRALPAFFWSKPIRPQSCEPSAPATAGC